MSGGDGRDDLQTRPRRFNPVQPGAAGMKARRDRPAGRDGRDLRRRPRASSPPIRGSATSRPSPKRRWSAALPTGSRSPPCSAIRSACRSRTPRSSRATRTASARRWPISSSENFLIAPVVARRMRNIDLAGAAGRFLQAPAGEGTRIRARRLAASSPTFSKASTTNGSAASSKARSPRASRKMEVSPLLGHALASAINEDRHVPMLEAAIRWIARALDANEALIREMVHKKANWVLKLAGLDAKLADAIIDGLRKLTVEMSHRPRPPGPGQDRGGARRTRQRPPDPARNARAGRGDEGAAARQQVGRPVARHACGRRAARRSSAPRATPTRRWPASSAKC